MGILTDGSDVLGIVPYYIGFTNTAVPAGKPITFEITKGGLGVGVGVGRLEIFYKQV